MGTEKEHRQERIDKALDFAWEASNGVHNVKAYGGSKWDHIDALEEAVKKLHEAIRALASTIA